MFLSYNFNGATKTPNGRIDIVDSNFKETVYPTMAEGIIGGFNYMLYNIVKVYEKKNLNVAANVIAYFSFLEKRYPRSNYSITEWMKKFKDETEFYDKNLYDYVFDKYGNDIERYLLLI